MQRSKRFEPIQQIVAASAEELAKRVAESGRRVAELDRQLTQLNSYRDEYVNSSKATQGVMDAVKLQNYRSFLDRLGEAIRQHVIKLDAARAEHEKRRVIWSDKRVEVESLGRALAFPAEPPAMTTGMTGTMQGESPVISPPRNATTRSSPIAVASLRSVSVHRCFSFGRFPG